MAELSDPDLIQRCRKGDQAAFGVIVERYQTPVYNAALRILHDPMEAEDVAQTVFLKTWENLDSYDPQYKVFSWIYRIAVNESLNARKKQRRFESLDDVGAARSESGDPDDGDAVNRALGGLLPEDRAIIILKHLDGFSYHDIGFIMDWPDATVKSRLYSARQRLKDIILAQQVNPRA
jgi:RNA polymerase sigma-70 factor (ECF subfamily)